MNFCKDQRPIFVKQAVFKDDTLALRPFEISVIYDLFQFLPFLFFLADKFFQVCR